MRRVVWFPAVCVVLAGLPAAAQSPWYEVILPERSFDLGTVARGSKLYHAFRIVNTTSYDVHIAGYRTRCGCTEVKLGAREIPPGTQTTVEATIDTTQFQGYKATGLTLVFDRPQSVEVDLNLSCFIRADVMLSPGLVDFGLVPRGASRTSMVNLAYYGGRPDWQVVRNNTISDHVSAELREVSRTPGDAVHYRLVVTLKPSAPAGLFKDEVTLGTNDPDSPTIPISVAADIQAAVTISPSSVLNLGRLRPGQEVTKTVLVKAGAPFRIVSATSDRPDLSATGQLGEAKPFHAVTVTFKAPDAAGPYHATLTFTTDMKDEPPAKLTAFATIAR